MRVSRARQDAASDGGKSNDSDNDCDEPSRKVGTSLASSRKTRKIAQKSNMAACLFCQQLRHKGRLNDKCSCQYSVWCSDYY